MKSPLPPGCARRYDARRHLSSGGHGAVYLARQLALDREVVVKVLHSHGNAAMAEQFRNEARITSTLVHPHIVVVLDHGVDSGVPWIVYEFLPGGTLRETMRRAPLELDAALTVIAQVAGALAHAHALQVVHADIKPENVLRGETGWKVVDFGLARLSARSAAQGPVAGTLPYLDADALRGQPPTTATDVYALGVMAYELLAGRLPFDASSLVELLAAQVNRRPPPLLTAAARVPPPVATLVDGMLGPAAGRPDAARVVRELRAFAGVNLTGDLSVVAVAVPRRRAPVRAIAAVAALGAIAGGLAWHFRSPLVMATPAAPSAAPVRDPNELNILALRDFITLDRIHADFCALEHERGTAAPPGGPVSLRQRELWVRRLWPLQRETERPERRCPDCQPESARLLRARLMVLRAAIHYAMADERYTVPYLGSVASEGDVAPIARFNAFPDGARNPMNVQLVALLADLAYLGDCMAKLRTRGPELARKIDAQLLRYEQALEQEPAGPLRDLMRALLRDPRSVAPPGPTAPVQGWIDALERQGFAGLNAALQRPCADVTPRNPTITSPRSSR